MIDSNGLFRIAPRIPINIMKTYRVAAPLRTHWRRGTCEEANCEAWRNGWVTSIDLNTELGQRQAHYITHDSGRRYREEKTPSSIVNFYFEAGQTCFRPHDIPLERDPLLIVRDGDFRGNPTGFRRVHSNVDDWIGDFAENQEKLRERL